MRKSLPSLRKANRKEGRIDSAHVSSLSRLRYPPAFNPFCDMKYKTRTASDMKSDDDDDGDTAVQN